MNRIPKITAGCLTLIFLSILSLSCKEEKKVEKAASLLKTNNSRVSDIAYEVGFDSLATFNRNFNSIYGKSPSEYRLS